MPGGTYLVTGGAGFIGSALVRRLIQTNDRVRVLDDGSRGSPRRLDDLDIEFIAADIRDPAAVREAVSGIDRIFHLAAVNGTENFYAMPEVVLEVALKGMLNILDASVAHGVRELYVASSSEVYQTPPRWPADESAPLSIPDPLNARYSYAGGKIASELLAINYGRKHFEKVVIFRPHNVYGPDMGREHVIPQLSSRISAMARTQRGTLAVSIQGTGTETRSFVHVEDLIDGLLLLRDRGEHLGIYHVGTDEEITIGELARQIGHCLDREVQLVPGPRLAGSVERRVPDISRMRGIGYAPKVPLRVGLPPTVRWYDGHPVEAGS